MFDIKYLII